MPNVFVPCLHSTSLGRAGQQRMCGFSVSGSQQANVGQRKLLIVVSENHPVHRQNTSLDVICTGKFCCLLVFKEARSDLFRRLSVIIVLVVNRP